MSPTQICPCNVPVDQILEARRTFPRSEVHHVVELSAPCPWVGLNACTAIFAATDLQLEALKCYGDGRVMCQLRDAPGFDPAQASVTLARTPELQLVRWTIVLKTS